MLHRRTIRTALGISLMLAGVWGACPAVAEISRFSSAWSGGTIAPGTTVVIEDGASITGDVVADGLLRFERSDTLTVSSTISGTGGLAVASTGTVALAGLASGTAEFNLAIAVSVGRLAIGSTGTNPLVIGRSGVGSITITGGTMSNGNTVLGAGAGGAGTATVDSGAWTGRVLQIGQSGIGTLTISSGSVGNSTSAVGTLGGVGMAVVGGGTWWHTGPLYVGGYSNGVSGNGTLEISGGMVRNTFGYIGFGAASVGEVVVSGGVWNSTQTFNVGSSGSGTLRVTDGLVSALNGAIGSTATARGMATITGGTFSTIGALVVGNAGIGTLTISGSGGTGGTVIVGGTLSRGAAGTISLDSGGTLQIGTGTTAARLATDLVNNGSLVFRPSGTSVLSHVVSGTGTVRVAGPGRLSVTGTSSYSGPTEVAGGSLLVSGALGSTAVNVNAGALLGGSGSVGGPVTVNAGGTLAPGASIESLEIGSLSLLDGSVFDVEIDSLASPAVAADFLRVTGDLTIAGTSVLTVTDLDLTPASFGPGTTLSLINYSGTWNGGLFSYGGTTLADGASFDIGSQLWTIDYDAVSGGANFAADYLPGGRFVNLTAVPEPATLGLLLAGLTCAAGLRPRRL